MTGRNFFDTNILGYTDDEAAPGKTAAVGGFREGASNFVGAEPIQDLREAFASEGYQLSETGELLPVVLDTLHGMDLTEALRA